jgi:RNA polymerase primary sigma factor
MITDSLFAQDRYFMEADRYPRLSPDEECDLARRYQQGDEHAGHWLVCCNLCLAISFTEKYSENALCERIDLIQQANIGLIRAAKSFNPESGYRFSTHAVSWILAEVSRYRDERSYAVHIPQHVHTTQRKRQRDASLKNGEATLEAARPWLTYAHRSLDALLPGDEHDDAQTYGDFLDDPDASHDFAVMLARIDLEPLLAKLPTTWRQVVEKRYGLYGEQPHDYVQLAALFGRSKTRMQQIDRQAIAFMRAELGSREGAAS